MRNCIESIGENIVCDVPTYDVDVYESIELVSKHHSLSETVEILNSTVSHQNEIMIQRDSIIESIDNLATTISINPSLDNQNQLFLDVLEKLSLSLSRQNDIMVQNQDLLNILEKLNNTLGTTPTGSLKEVIIGAIFSVIAAFVFNVAYWAMVDKRKKLNSSIIKFNTVLDRFEKTATEYWTFGYHKRHSKKNLIQEMTIKAEHKILRQCKDGIVNHIRQKKLNKNTDLQLKSHLSTLFDAATGGDFESSQREADLKRVGEIIKVCTQIRMVVSGLNV